MVEKPSTVDEAIAYVWDVPDTVIELADKQSLAAALAEKTDAVARRYFSAPIPELWVGTLRELLKPTGTFSQTYINHDMYDLCLLRIFICAGFAGCQPLSAQPGGVVCGNVHC